MGSIQVERPPRPAGTRGTHLRSLQRRFTRRWMSGIAAGLTLLAANWVYSHRALARAASDVRGVPIAEAALERFDAFNTVLALIAAAVLAILALFLFRPLDRTLRAEGAWLDETEAAQAHEATRARFSAELHEALEMATEEQAITRVVEHVLGAVVDRPAELLLADSSEAHLAVVASHPRAGAPGCQVEAPFACPAVRRASPQTFPTSTAINACPHLRDRPGDPRSAHCVSVTFMGRSLGVLHVTGPDGEVIGREAGERLGELASQVGSHIGTVRSFARAELQAGTDSLTGLPNRRSAEAELSRRLLDGERLAVAIADLDHFKLLNDTYGHEAGDRALRLFADAVRASLRTEDTFARWGGEEFVIALPFADRFDAREALDRARQALEAACAKAETPGFTASFGVADTTQADRLDELLRTADKALLRAKAAGRDRVHGAERLGGGEPVVQVDGMERSRSRLVEPPSAAA
jgi:diguanylate cyclase (GGDEF)-like protein